MSATVSSDSKTEVMGRLPVIGSETVPSWFCEVVHDFMALSNKLEYLEILGYEEIEIERSDNSTYVVRWR
jgi:hypothetical protein